MRTRDEYQRVLEYYIDALLFRLDDLFEIEVISRFNDHRERIEEGILKYGIPEDQPQRLHTADLVCLQNMERVLEWWEEDSVYAVRKKWIGKIKREWWFWWLDEIVVGTYPFEMIPGYLREEASKYYGKTNNLRKA